MKFINKNLSINDKTLFFANDELLFFIAQEPKIKLFAYQLESYFEFDFIYTD